MHTEVSERGFRALVHEAYPDGGDERIVCESSAIGDYQDSMAKPGSSFLWVGDKHHLCREDVAKLAAALEFWLVQGRLPAPGEDVVRIEPAKMIEVKEE